MDFLVELCNWTSQTLTPIRNKLWSSEAASLAIPHQNLADHKQPVSTEPRIASLTRTQDCAGVKFGKGNRKPDWSDLNNEAWAAELLWGSVKLRRASGSCVIARRTSKRFALWCLHSLGMLVRYGMYRVTLLTGNTGGLMHSFKIW